MRRQTLCIPLIPLVLFLCLSGCQGSVQENNLALALRADFLAMDGREFFREVCSHLTPEELEEYLEENPDERVYMKERPVK